MPYLTAHFLDRLNEILVRMRLSGRLPTDPGEPIVSYMGNLGDGVHPHPGALGPLRPEQVDGRLWSAPSPWPGAGGNNRTWYAERFVALAATGDTGPDGTGTTSGLNAGPDVTTTDTPAVILLHGWLIDRPQLIVHRWWARRVAALGVEVWLPYLPYHMQRTGPGEISGQRALSPDLSMSVDMVRQAVAETRLLAAWLRDDGRPVGLWGMSLGGWVAGLATTLEPEWAAVALWAPVAAPADVLFESRLMEQLREVVVSGGQSLEESTAPEVAPITPDRCTTLVDRDRMLVIAGVYDQVVSPRSVARLARRWNVDVHWVPHGHISVMAAPAPVRRTAKFLQHTLRR